jgi:HD superfamily phosphohydrolase
MSKHIRDNVYGFVELNDDEVKAIGHPFYQRLRRIKQNGLLELLYPAAKHDRFQHSLGVSHLMKLALQHFDSGTYGMDKGMMDAYGKSLRWAALLHDIGHFPLSHTCEKAAGANHEKFGAWLLENTPVGDLLPSDIEKKEIGRLITGEALGKSLTQRPWFVRQLMKSDLDMDRMDYLLRDSVNIGIPYGNIGYTQLLRSFRISGRNEKLCIEDKAIPTADGMELARVSMYTQVYAHKVNDSYSQMMNKIYTANPEIFPSVEQIKENIAKDPTFWEEFDDIWIWNRLREISKDSKNATNRYATMILKRQHLKLAHELREWRPLNDRGENYLKYNRLIEDINHGSFQDCPANADEVLAGETNVKYSEIAPQISIGELGGEREGENLPDAIWVSSTRRGWEEPRLLVSLPESLTNLLGGKALFISRVYSVGEKRDMMRTFVDAKCRDQGIKY